MISFSPRFRIGAENRNLWAVDGKRSSIRSFSTRNRLDLLRSVRFPAASRDR